MSVISAAGEATAGKLATRRDETVLARQLKKLHADKLQYRRVLALQQLARDPDAAIIRLEFHYLWNTSDTLSYLMARIQNLLGQPEAVVTIHGGVNRDDRRKIQEAFRFVPAVLVLVALPLDEINAAASREKSIRHGYPSTLHLWWARRPLAAARAVLFAQLVNDPGGERGYCKGKAQADAEREELFNIIRELVKWENTNNEEVLERARAAIRRSWRETCELNKGKPGFDPDRLPAFHDPFAGGGAIPLEARRLGLEAYASDLNRWRC